MTETMKPVLDVRGLRVEIPTRHGVLTALDDINLTIAPGEIVGMVGESGAGIHDGQRRFGPFAASGAHCRRGNLRVGRTH